MQQPGLVPQPIQQQIPSSMQPVQPMQPPSMQQPMNPAMQAPVQQSMMQPVMQPMDQQYQQQLSQQWMMMQQQQPPPPPAGFVPPPVPLPYPWVTPVTQQSSGEKEIKSLWIGDLQPGMDENYLMSIFAPTGEAVSAKVIRNKQTQEPEGYGFVEFVSRAAAERILLTYNGTLMPGSDQNFRLNWATLAAGERRHDDGPDYTIFVGDLSADVTDYILQETFQCVYKSVKGAKVVTDRLTGRSKGYGFVRFGDETEQTRAMIEMNGQYCSTRPMRIGPAATKSSTIQQYTKTTYQDQSDNPGENDPNNTTIFVGALDPSVSDDTLRTLFGKYGELIHVKIPVGKRCGFVQFANRSCAEIALQMLNGTVLGGHSIRLSWGRSPSQSQKQAQSDQTQWNGGYYGYPQQGFDNYGYPSTPQDPSMYFGGYPPYANFQQPTTGGFPAQGGFQQQGQFQQLPQQ